MCKEPINELDKMLFLGLALIHNVMKKWLSMFNRNLHNCIHISVPVPLHLEHFCNWKERQP